MAVATSVRRNTAGAKSPTDQIEDFISEAKSFEEEILNLEGKVEELQSKLSDARQRQKHAYDQIAEISAKVGSELASNPVPASNSVIPARRFDINTSVGSKSEAVREVKPRGNTSRKGGKTGPRNSNNEMSLAKAIWTVLDRSESEHRRSIPDLPIAAEGLTVADVRDIIVKEKLWTSSSENITSMLQQQFMNLRHEGKIVRGTKDDRRNHIRRGAKLYGPPYNEDGTLMKEQSDGTYITKDGEVFTRMNSEKPWKLPRKGRQE